MSRPEPFVRAAGAGPAVVCIHSNASSSGQWRGLGELLAPKYRVLAPDLYGSGKSPIASSVANVRRWAHALTTESTPLSAFRGLEIPILYMVGKRSTASAHGIARILVPALPQVTLVEFDALGHMGPITHPAVVNAAIERFVEQAAPVR